MNNHKDWFDTTTEGATKAEESANTDIANSTIAHQYRAGQLSATTVIAIARAYGVNVIQALVDTGTSIPTMQSFLTHQTSVFSKTEYWWPN